MTTRVVISGASAGIGRATAWRMAEQGAELVLVARSRESLEQVAREVEERGGRPIACAADTSDGPGLAQALEGPGASLGGVDVVIAGAAAVAWGPFADMTAEDFDRTVAVTFTGTVNLVRALLPEVRRSHGSIVIVGSVAGEMPVPDMAPYVAAKHALRGFANSLALELRREGSGVAVTHVKPGPVSTALWEQSTSAGGDQLRMPPLSYRLEAVVDEIARAVDRPGGEVTVGAAARAQVLAFGLARPLYEAAAVRLSRLAATGSPAARPGALWESHHTPSLRASASRGRPSILSAARRVRARLRRT